MKTLCKRSLGVFLTLLLMVGMLCVGGYSVIAATVDSEGTGATSASGHTIYFQNTKNWSSVYCYMWNSDNGNKNNAAWPGEKMTDEGDGVWSYDITDEYNKVIFNPGSDSGKTLDLPYPGDGMIYTGSEFEKYDTSPLRITAFTCDTQSPAYMGSAITFTTETKSDTGAVVQYQYSVNNSVSQTYSTNSKFTWTPAVSGTYTIKVDVKDNAGNTNTRDMSFEIKDPSQEVKPVYLSATPNNASTIKTGTTTNLSINAAGGKTGTNLLFYKYVVKDPSGTQMNTAYYTLNKNFTFTPSKEGNYTVEVSIQGSDNQTITQKLQFVSSNNAQTTSSSSETIPTEPVGLLGDVDNNNTIDISDATLIQKCALKIPIQGTFIQARADYNQDGRVDIQDVTAVQKVATQGM